MNHVLVDQLHLVGGDRPFWLIGQNSFYSLVIVEVWRTWPFAFLMLTAGMQSISQDLYEAAGLDGAGVWAQLRGVTLPMLRPVNRVLLLVLFLWTFNDFNTPFALFGKGAPRQADLISMHIYQNSFVTWNFGTGSAMSVLLLIFLLVVTGGYLRLVNRGATMREPTWFKWARAIGLTLLALFALIPVWVMVTSALKPLADVQERFTWWPSHLSTKPFVEMWKTIPLAHYFVNSLIVSTIASIASVVVALLAAYSLSRYRFRGRQTFSVVVLSTQMFPGILFLLPLFVIFVNLGNTTGLQLYGSRTGLIVTYMTFTLPFAIWMLAGYLDSVPRELDEAAKVDGCGPLGAFVRVVIPAAMPGIIAVLIYAFMTAWGEVLFASVLTDDSTRTLAVGLQGYATQNNVYWNQIMAASLTVSVPVVVGFLVLQRYLVAGMTAGSVK